jgi:hypothetical protein
MPFTQTIILRPQKEVSGGIVLEEAVDLLSDRLLMMMMRKKSHSNSLNICLKLLYCHVQGVQIT